MEVSLKSALTGALPVEARLRVETEDAYDPAPEMVILQASAHWVFGRALDETGCPDGCIALRRDHVQEFHTTPVLLFRKRALEWQGLWPREISVPVPDLRDAGAILDALRREHRLAIVLTETRDGWNSIHCRVGKVDRLPRRSSVSMVPENGNVSPSGRICR